MMDLFYASKPDWRTPALALSSLALCPHQLWWAQIDPGHKMANSPRRRGGKNLFRIRNLLAIKYPFFFSFLFLPKIALGFYFCGIFFFINIVSPMATKSHKIHIQRAPLMLFKKFISYLSPASFYLVFFMYIFTSLSERQFLSNCKAWLSSLVQCLVRAQLFCQHLPYLRSPISFNSPWY